MKLLFVLLVFVFPAHGAPGDYGSIGNLGEWLTFGPVFNFSFGNGDVVFSGGLNIAYWDLNRKIPIGIDIGLERSENSETIVYTELQTGVIFAGGSAGIVYNSKVGFGMQASVWGTMLSEEI